jgi:hypothetical protein
MPRWPTPERRPCPFCGSSKLSTAEGPWPRLGWNGEPSDPMHAWVVCRTCDAEGPKVRIGGRPTVARHKAIWLWNGGRYLPPRAQPRLPATP